jgi:dienelactone hydrolase
MKHDLGIPAAGCLLCAELRMAERPSGIVVLVHGSGVTRQDSLNRFVAASLVRAGFAALLVDLLEDCEVHERHNVFDVEAQAARLIAVKDWLRAEPATRALDIGYFGTGVGAGIVLVAAAKAPPRRACSRLPRRPSGHRALLAAAPGGAESFHHRGGRRRRAMGPGRLSRRRRRAGVDPYSGQR